MTKIVWPVWAHREPEGETAVDGLAGWVWPAQRAHFSFKAVVGWRLTMTYLMAPSCCFCSFLHDCHIWGFRRMELVDMGFWCFFRHKYEFALFSMIFSNVDRYVDSVVPKLTFPNFENFRYSVLCGKFLWGSCSGRSIFEKMDHTDPSGFQWKTASILECLSNAKL